MMTLSSSKPYSYRANDYSVISLQCFKDFKKLHPEYKDILKVLYEDIIRAYADKITDYLIETGLPHNSIMGELQIKKYLPKYYVNLDGTKNRRRCIDWVNSKKFGKKIYYTNSHTDGYILRGLRKPTSGNFFLKEYWSFKFGRFANRKLGEIMQGDERHRLLGKYSEHIMSKNDII